jgi:hypothetical protein
MSKLWPHTTWVTHEHNIQDLKIFCLDRVMAANSMCDPPLKCYERYHLHAYLLSFLYFSKIYFKRLGKVNISFKNEI